MREDTLKFVFLRKLSVREDLIKVDVGIIMGILVRFWTGHVVMG